MREAFSSRQGGLVSVDPRIKLVSALLFCGVILWTQEIRALVLLLALSAVTLVIFRPNAQFIALRLGPGLVMAGGIFAAQVFLCGHTPVFTLGLGSWSLTGYAEGIRYGVVSALRVVTAVTLLSVLTATTAPGQLLFALKCLRVPEAIIEIATLAYRYIFVLRDEASQVHRAQKSRLGYGSWRASLDSTGALGGILIIRALDRSMRLYQAMCCRGYRGKIAVTCPQALTRRDWLFAAGCGLLWLFLVVLSLYQ